MSSEGLTMNQLAEKNAEYITQVANLTEQRDALAVESNTNLHSAAHELNTSWMMHKTMMGAQAALLCISQGDIKSARDWLEGTTDEAFTEMPDDMTPSGLQAWFDSNMVSEDGRSGFLTHEEALERLRQRAPATSSAIAVLRAEGAHFVANRMLAAWEAGFIEDTAKNAADIARMILTSTKFMADAPIGDIDRSFADGVLEDIARQLRESQSEGINS